MKLNSEELRQHYESLSDDALFEIDRNDLVELAQRIYDEEVARRDFHATREVEPEDSDDDSPKVEAWKRSSSIAMDEHPKWSKDAVCACTFWSKVSMAQQDAIDGRNALVAAGIPCYVSMAPSDEGEDPPTGFNFKLMVPGALNLHATSVLDRDFFNPRQEDDWRTHLASLSDEELHALDPAIFCAGFLDRASRLKKVFREEVARRQSG